MRTGKRKPSSTQQGTALLLLVLLLLVAGTHALIHGVDAHGAAQLRRTRDAMVVESARRALLDYAVNYPELRHSPVKGPGFLPCPDRDNDGSPASNCSVNTGSTLGRLPFRILGTGDLRDSSGERLWYAVSQSFRNTVTDSAVMNSDTPADLTLDGETDIAALVIAPGAPLAGQPHRPGNLATAYLECGNAEGLAVGFTATCATACAPSARQDCFNDVVAVITRRQLVAAIGQRVAAEARAALARYRELAGTHPWLAPFADPRAAPSWVGGRHNGADDSRTLRDSRVLFTAAGVVPGDRIWNLDDGSTAIVSGVREHELEFDDGLVLGEDNRFDRDDRYTLTPGARPALLQAIAGAGSNGQWLRVPDRDFTALGVVPGDIVDDADRGSSAVIEGVEPHALRIRMAVGDPVHPGDRIRLRGNGGIVTGTGPSWMADADLDLARMGVRPGDVIRARDDMFARIAATGPDRLYLEDLAGDAALAGDPYRVTRFAPVPGTRFGLLPLHLPGEAFASAFSLEWSLPAQDGNQVTVTGGQLAPEYVDGLMASVQSSDGTGGHRVGRASGNCLWVAPAIADCRGVITEGAFLEFSATGVVAGDGSGQVETDVDLLRAGVKPGDRVANLSRGTAGLVIAVPGSHALTIAGIPGDAPLLADVGERFRVRVAARAQAVQVLSSDPARNRICTGTPVPAPGDTLAGAAGAVAVVLRRERPRAGAPRCVRHSPPAGSAPAVFPAGQETRWLSGFVDVRRIAISIRMRGEMTVTADTGMRRRDVCLGYGPGCGGSAYPVFLRQVADGTVITITDLDQSGASLASASVSVPPAEAGARGSLRVSGLEYLLRTGDDDLPEWFIHNRWHQYVLAAYGPALAPGAAGTCPAGSGCIVLRHRDRPGDQASARELVVLSSGPPLPGQERAGATLDAYLEDDNALYDETFSSGPVSEMFNDQISVMPR